MVNVDSQVLQIANSTCNAAGVLLAAVAVAAIFQRKFSKLFWAVPAVLLSAWLKTKLNPAFAGSLSSDGTAYRHMAIDVLAFSMIALVFVWLRLKTARKAGSGRQSGSISANIGARTWTLSLILSYETPWAGFGCGRLGRHCISC